MKKILLKITKSAKIKNKTKKNIQLSLESYRGEQNLVGKKVHLLFTQKSRVTSTLSINILILRLLNINCISKIKIGKEFFFTWNKL